MKWRRGPLTWLEMLLFGAAIIMILIWLSALGQGPGDQGANNAAAQQDGKFLTLSPAAWTAWFTAILTVATLLMRWDMVRTMRETKKSADAYVMSESGRMMVLDVLINKGYDRVAMAYQNVGRGPVKVLLFSIEYDAIPADVKPELAKHPYPSLIEAPVLSSEIFATADFGPYTGTTRMAKKWTVHPNVIEKVKSPYNRFWFQSILGYETGMGEYRELRHSGFFLAHNDAPSMYPFAPYSEDVLGSRRAFDTDWVRSKPHQILKGRANLENRFTPKSTIRGSLRPLTPAEKEAWNDQKKGWRKRG